MKKIVVLSLLLLTVFVAGIYTKKAFGGDSILWNGTVDAARSDSVGVDHFNYSGGGLIDGTIPNAGGGNTLLKSKAAILNSGSIDSGGNLQLNLGQQPGSIHSKK